MDYEKQMELERKKKSRKQLITLLVVIALLLGFLYWFNGQSKTRSKKKFETIAKETWNSVNENYKSDSMFGEATEDKVYIFPDKNILNFDERTLKGGTIIQYQDGNVAFAIYNNDWCAIKRKTSGKVEIIEYQENQCQIEK